MTQNTDLSKSHIPTVLVVSFTIACLAGLSAFAVWGVSGNIRAWQLESEANLLASVARERQPLQDKVDEIYVILQALQADTALFKKSHYEALRKSVGRGDPWPIYDDLSRLAGFPLQ